MGQHRNSFSLHLPALRGAAVALLLALGTSPALAQSGGSLGGGSGMLGGGIGGLGEIGGPAARAGVAPTPVIRLPEAAVTPAPPPPVGTGYGTPGYGASLGAASNSGVGAGVENDIRTGIDVNPVKR